MYRSVNLQLTINDLRERNVLRRRWFSMGLEKFLSRHVYVESTQNDM